MARISGWLATLLVIPALTLLHLCIAPYTKVEESFNVQAVHDLLTYGIPRYNVSEQFKTQHDHMTFPGAVPRTFIGALVLAGLSRPVLWINDSLERQSLVRALLGCLNAISLSYYANNARKAFGTSTAVWYILFQGSQFHIIYYASRLLPNMFAFGLTTVALSLLLPETVPVKVSLNRIRLAVSLLTVTAIIFRSEVAILLFCHVAYILLKQIARFGHLTQGITLLTGTIIPAGILGTFIGLGMTIPVDTFFWQSPIYLWPEFSAFLSNILPSDNSLGASAWGTQPWHWYFTSALPRLLMRPFIDIALYLFAISTSAISERALDLLLPNLSYIVIYSLLPHKETRFIFPVVPPLTLAAALSASYIWTRRHRTLLYHIPSIILVLSTLLSALIAHAVLLPLSALSYTGAHALQTLHNNASSLHNLQTINQNSNNTIRVHLDNLSTQTGITRFLQRSTTSQSEGDNWVYDKSENATDLLNPFWWTRFNYAIMESPQLAIGSWDVVSTTGGLGPIRLLRPDERRPKKIPGLEGKEMEFWDDGLDRVAFEMYGHAGHWTSVAARQLLREGYGVHWMLGRSWSWTNGWWADVGWVPKLYILEQRGSLATEALEQHPCPPTL